MRRKHKYKKNQKTNNGRRKGKEVKDEKRENK
jgi:hypothetical protein